MLKISKNIDKQQSTKTSITKKQASDYELIASAYHESSHTIVGLANLLFIDDVSITIDNGGDTNYFMYLTEQTINSSLKKIIALSELKTIYAGLVGEKIYYRDVTGSHLFPMFLKIGSSMDTAMGSDIIRKNNLANSGNDTYLLKNNIKEELEKFLIEHWQSVKDIAHALYKRKKLRFSELKYILIRGEDGDFWKDRFKKIKLLHNDKCLSEKTVKEIINPRLVIKQ